MYQKGTIVLLILKLTCQIGNSIEKLQTMPIPSHGREKAVSVAFTLTYLLPHVFSLNNSKVSEWFFLPGTMFERWKVISLSFSFSHLPHKMYLSVSESFQSASFFLLFHAPCLHTVVVLTSHLIETEVNDLGANLSQVIAHLQTTAHEGAQFLITNGVPHTVTC